ATGRTFGWAARSSYFPQLVPREAFANAVTWNSSVFQIGSVIGPALGGLLIVRAGFPFIYALDAACAFSFFLLVLPIRSSDRGSSTERNAWRSLKEGIRFILHKQVVLATITLDMFAVFLGGGTALLQLVTPDTMRGRISAVNNIFIGTSNELGALESGLTAALFGPVISVVAGGVGTILVVLGVSWIWPETRKIGALDKNLP